MFGIKLHFMVEKISFWLSVRSDTGSTDIYYKDHCKLNWKKPLELWCTQDLDTPNDLYISPYIYIYVNVFGNVSHAHKIRPKNRQTNGWGQKQQQNVNTSDRLVGFYISLLSLTPSWSWRFFLALLWFALFFGFSACDGFCVCLIVIFIRSTHSAALMRPKLFARKIICAD